MKRRALVIVLAVTAGTAAFYAGHNAPGRETTPSWLQDVPPEVVWTERQFEQQAHKLAGTVRAEHNALSLTLADPRVTGDQVLAQVESILDSHAALMRSVARHLMQLRAHLPQEQRLQLMLSCAHSLQGQVQRRYRWRGGAQVRADEHPGRWGRGGGGFGGGYGRQYRRGRDDGGVGLVRRLGLTEEQTARAQEYDPDFADECAALRDELRATHVEFAASFAGPLVRDEDLLLRLERLIDAHARLERRVARHIVQLRPHLSREQLDRLSSACSDRPGACGGNPALLNLGAIHLFGILSPAM